MTDIVERLRGLSLLKDLPGKDARLAINLSIGEIMKLRGEVSYLKDEVIPALKAEAERVHGQSPNQPKNDPALHELHDVWRD